MENGRVMCERGWVSCEEKTEGDHADITVMTYNILSDHYCKQGEYSYCPEDIRYENSRGPHVISEIQQYNPDVMCFQEVSERHYMSMLSPGLEKMGYTGVHMPYTYRPEDGLVMFYKQSVLVLEDIKHFQAVNLINDYAKEINFDISAMADLTNQVKECGGLMVAHFKQTSTGQSVLIGNTHVTWTKMQLPVLQTLEVALSLKELISLADGAVFICCGDFNSPQTFEPYHLLEKGSLRPEKDRGWNPAQDVRLFQLKKKGDGSDGYCYEEEAVEVSPDKILKEAQRDGPDFDFDILLPLTATFSKGIPLKSAYYTVTGREPEVTNCDADAWCGYVSELCLDYLWYSPGLQATRVLEPPSRDSIRQQGALPNHVHPSDHIPLMAGFKRI